MNTEDAAEGHDVVGWEAWAAERLAHLEREKALTRQRDELSAERRALPWLEITEDYTFEGSEGTLSLPDLFDGRRQLLVYHFMFGPDWDEGCPSCSFWADNYDGTQVHLAHRDTALVTVARAPLADIEAYKARMGWGFRWVSSFGTRFNYDMGVSFDDAEITAGEPNYNYDTITFPGDEAPGISAFVLDDDRVYLTYQTFARGLDMLNGAYHLLDLTAAGRNEDSLDWSMQWLHRHDAYPDDPTQA